MLNTTKNTLYTLLASGFALVTISVSAQQKTPATTPKAAFSVPPQQSTTTVQQKTASAKVKKSNTTSVPQDELPFKAPPGQTVTVTSRFTTYNFSKLNRELPLPMQAFIWQPNEVKEGYKIVDGLHRASKQVTDLHNNLQSLYPEIGAPSRVVVQGIVGKQGPGTILYVEYPVDMPVDARQRISRLLYGADTVADPGSQIDQHFVSKNMFILWSFKDTKSLAREAHQKKTFELLSVLATEWDRARKAATGNSSGQ